MHKKIELFLINNGTLQKMEKKRLNKFLRGILAAFIPN